MRLSLPGAHSNGMGEEGENIPEWVAIFHQFHELKKSNPSKAAVEEQKRTQRRTMQRSIITPAEPFGNVVPSDHLPNETSTSTARHQSSNTLVVNGGTMSVVPVTHSTASSGKKKSRRVSTDVSPVPKSRGVSGSRVSNVRSDLSQILEAMENSNRALFRRSLREVLLDLDDVAERLSLARQAQDNRSVSLYEGLRDKLEAELRAVS